MTDKTAFDATQAGIQHDLSPLLSAWNDAAAAYANAYVAGLVRLVRTVCPDAARLEWWDNFDDWYCLYVATEDGAEPIIFDEFIRRFPDAAGLDRRTWEGLSLAVLSAADGVYEGELSDEDGRTYIYDLPA